MMSIHDVSISYSLWTSTVPSSYYSSWLYFTLYFLVFPLSFFSGCYIFFLPFTSHILPISYPSYFFLFTALNFEIIHISVRMPFMDPLPEWLQEKSFFWLVLDRKPYLSNLVYVRYQQAHYILFRGNLEKNCPQIDFVSSSQEKNFPSPAHGEPVMILTAQTGGIEFWVGIHKRFGARKKTGSEPIFLRIGF